MPAIRTEVTEIVTGLGMLGFRDLDHALAAPPRALVGVTDETMDALRGLRAAGEFESEFEMAWANGSAFAQSAEGLRGRPPWRIEWKGPHKPPGYEQIPADLRVDHVYLISCKYGSDIIHNSSPAQVFDRLLGSSTPGRDGDWFASICPSAYSTLWSECRRHLQAAGVSGLPDDPTDLEPHQRKAVASGLGTRAAWPADLVDSWRWFALSVATQSADRWRSNLRSKARREEMLWRLLRFQAAPYFVLGSSAKRQRLCFRVSTPWDFRSAFEFVSFDVGARDAGQPVVDWVGVARCRESGRDMEARGHVEVRWSHGRFGGNPEAKVYLDSAHHDVPGYVPIDRK